MHVPRKALHALAVGAALTMSAAHAAERRKLVFEVDREALEQEDVASLRIEARAAVRNEPQAAAVTTEPTSRGLRIVLADASARAKVGTALRALSRPLPGNGSTLEVRADASSVSVALTDAALDDHVHTSAAQTVAILQRRLDAAGIRDGAVTRADHDRICVEVADTATASTIPALLATQAKLEFRRVADASQPQDDIETLRLDEGGVVGEKIKVERRAIVTGEDLVDAREAVDAVTNEPVVDIRMSDAAAARFGRFTAANIGRQVALVLDGRVLSVPRILTAITGGAAQISGRFTSVSAQRLALLLRAGALPAKLQVVSIRIVPPPERGK